MELDKRKIRLAFDRAAETYDQAAVLQRRMADELLERLDLVTFAPRVVLEVGCGTGYALSNLARRYPRAWVIGLDIAPAMLRKAHRRRRWFARPTLVAADAESLPLPDASVDLLFSSATMQWCDLDQCLMEFQRVLRPSGLLTFTTYGPDTLQELRQAWRTVDDCIHVHEFIDMHDVGDALMRHRFAEPVMDVDRVTVTYAGVDDALNDLRHLGATNAACQRAKGLTGKGRLQQLHRACNSVQQDSVLRATYEIVYGHAWVPEHKSRAESDGSVSIPLSNLRPSR